MTRKRKRPRRFVTWWWRDPMRSGHDVFGCSRWWGKGLRRVVYGQRRKRGK